MLNVFPALLTYAINAPTILRIALVAVLLFVAYRQWKQRKIIAAQKLPLFFPSGMWVVWLSIAWELATAVLLLLGLYTQIGALMGLVMALKLFWWHRHYPEITVLSKSASFLVAMICLSLMFSGAGQPAFDIFL